MNDGKKRGIWTKRKEKKKRLKADLKEARKREKK